MRVILSILILLFSSIIYAADNVAKSLQANFCNENCSNLVTENKTLEFCDESLDKLPELTQYLNYYKLTELKKSCVSLSVKLNSKNQFETIWKLLKLPNSAEIPDPVYISVEECKKRTSTFPLFNCIYKTILLENLNETELQIFEGKVSFVVLTKNRPLKLEGAKKTYRSRVFNGKSKRFDYFLKPINVPSSRKLLVTQCYQSSFSHAQFEIDFNLVNREEVLSTDMGIVTQNYQGSPIRCHSYTGTSGETRFDIYWNGIYVGENLAKCKVRDCSVNVMPWYCSSSHSANRVVIKHPDNTFSHYVHLTKVNTLTQFGDVIKSPGVPIANIGVSGWITGPHLHFEILDLVKNANGVTDFFSIPTYFNTKNYGVTWPCAKGGKYLAPALP